jgi:hypothetical protein
LKEAAINRIDLLPANWREFVLCMLMLGLLPLAPLIFELIAKGFVSNASMLIGAAMYTVGIGFSCQNKLILITSMMAMTALSFMHGIAITNEGSSVYYHWTAVFCIISFAIALFLNKFNSHVIDNKQFWLFE